MQAFKKLIIGKIDSLMSSPRKSFIFCIFLIIFAIFLAFSDYFLRGFGIVQWDAREVHLYNLIFSTSFWHSMGSIPLWNPFIFSGFPQIADPQVAIFYPINFLVGFLKFFSPTILMYQLILHYILAGIFMFLLVRYLTKNIFIGCFAGIAYTFSGFMVGHASHIGMQNTAALFPLVLYLGILTIENKKYIHASLFGVAFASSFLAGHFQTFLFITFFIGFFLIYEIIFRKDYKVFRTYKLFGLAALIFFLLISVQFLPSFQLRDESIRSGITLELSQTESLNPSSLFGFLNPNFRHVAFGGTYTGPWDRTENYLFIGISTFLLAIFGSIFSKKRLKFFLLSFFILACLYSFGKYFFVQRLFYEFVPFFNKIRAPANMMLLAEFSMILLGSFGLLALKEKLKNRFPKIYVYIPLIAVFVIFIEMVPLTRINKLLYGRGWPDVVMAEPPIVQTIQSDYSKLDKNNFFSTFRLNEIGIDRNFLQIFGVYSADGYNPLTLSRQQNYEEAMVQNSKLVDLAGIKYLPCKYILSEADNLKKIDDNICINENYFPVSFFVNNFNVATNEQDVLNLLKNNDSLHNVVLEKMPPFGADSSIQAADSEIKILQNKPGYWNIEVKNSKNGFLILRQTYYPGWQAKVNDRQIEIYRADYLFSAIPLQAGVNSIELEFKPQLFYIGEWLSLGGIIFLFIFAGFAIYKRFTLVKF